MITSLNIVNFQAHSKRVVELDPHVTTIVGQSDVGKSSIIRAIRWACLNDPVSNLIHEGAKTADVLMEVDDHRITRRRGTENVYILDNQEFRAFRTDVPDSIASLLNLSELNFQSQHDAPFWFGLTPGEVSRQLNAVVDLQIIDKASAEITRTYNKAKVKAQVAEEQLQKSVQDRDSLKWVAECDQEYDEVEAAEKAAEDLRLKVQELRNQLTLVNQKRDEKARLKSLADDMATLVDLAKDAGRAARDVKQLESVILDVRAAEKSKGIEVPDTTELGRAAELWADAKKNVVDLRSVLRDAQEKLNEMKAARVLADRAAAELTEKMAGRCPVCGKEMAE